MKWETTIQQENKLTKISLLEHCTHTQIYVYIFVYMCVHIFVYMYIIHTYLLMQDWSHPSKHYFELHNFYNARNKTLKFKMSIGTWGAQLVKHPALAQVRISWFVSSSPALGSAPNSAKPAWDLLYPSLCPSPPQKQKQQQQPTTVAD